MDWASVNVIKYGISEEFSEATTLKGARDNALGDWDVVQARIRQACEEHGLQIPIVVKEYISDGRDADRSGKGWR